jgi:hypothetical protein
LVVSGWVVTLAVSTISVFGAQITKSDTGDLVVALAEDAAFFVQQGQDSVDVHGARVAVLLSVLHYTHVVV